MRIVFTKHAEDMLAERRLSRDLVVDTVRSPEWREAGEGNVWYAFRRVGAKVIRVVIADEGEAQVIKSRYFDRRVR